MKVNKICGIWPRGRSGPIAAQNLKPLRRADLHNLIQRANINTELQRDRRPRDELLLRGFHFILRLLAQDGQKYSHDALGKHRVFYSSAQAAANAP